MARPLLIALAALAASAHAASPLPGFRPPSVPIVTGSPFINVWSPSHHLYDLAPRQWSGGDDFFFSAARVDGTAYLLMGNPSPDWAKSGALQTATQTNVAVFATQTVYSFSAGPIALNLTFTSPLLTEDWELLSRPAHYITYDVIATDAGSHSVQLYFDSTANPVVTDPTALVAWSRLPITGVGIDAPVTALRLGADSQCALCDSGPDRPDWGIIYVAAGTDPSNGNAQMALEYSNTTRSMFFASGTIPSADNPNSPSPLVPAGPPLPATGPQVGIDRGGGDMPGSPFTLPSADYNLCWDACNKSSTCKAWAYAIPNCDSYTQPTCWLKGDYPATSQNKCRVSGAQAGQPSSLGDPIAAAVVYDLGNAVTSAQAVSRFVMFAVDEILLIEWFGEACPPYWRRNLPVNDSTVVPMDMLSIAFGSYTAVRALCNGFDASTATMLSSVGGDEYATIAQLTYRQVFGASGLFWVPSKQAAWYMLKEISSCGCLDTADVVYPAFPQILYYSPELMRLMIVPHLEYAMNYTNQPYPLPWAPHHLGHWPIADLPYTGQENMPLEETAWDLLIIAAIAQRQNGDLTWLEPYWPAITSWYEFLITLLPFPGTQLSTDDFDGPLYNATNLALKGVAAIAAYGYILEQYTGNATAAAEAYAIAATYSSTMVQYAWNSNGTDSHFMIGYKGSQKDGGDPGSWPMLYNALWLRLFGFDNLLPNQAQYLDTMSSWYAANKLNEYGLPLNSRQAYTKLDWMTFLAAFYYGADNQPSTFTNQLFDGLFSWANETTSREAISDWVWTNQPTAVGFTARPVFGAMYAPVLVAQGPSLGLGRRDDPALMHAREVFARVHKEQEEAGLVLPAVA